MEQTTKANVTTTNATATNGTMDAPTDLGERVLELCKWEFNKLKEAGDKCFAQLTAEEMHWKYGEESNSIAVIIQHLAGNMRSRWTDFYTSDLEKPDRDRDTEFVERKMTKEELIERWETGWKYVFTLLDSLTPDDLLRTVRIRTIQHSTIGAAFRQATHYAEHVGQIIYITKMIKDHDWQTLSIPRGKSKEYLAPPVAL